MLQDYEMKRTKSRFEKWVPFIELLLAVIFIQSLVLFVTAAQPEEETIRFRLLAHSNAPADQFIKMEIQHAIEPLIEQATHGSSTKEELGNQLALVENEILRRAKMHAGTQEVTLVRQAALFPPKRSGLFIQPQSTYDAYILTIGSGRGDNWWCAVFPKVCFGDNETAEVEKEEEEVTFFLWEWIKGII